MKRFLTRTGLGCTLAFCQQLTADDVEIVAHRGASYDAPENTLESVKLGWEQGADAVEVDVYLSKDGYIVVHHDSDTKKTAGVNRKVVDQTLAELQQLDVGARKGAKWNGVRIPELDDVLVTIPEGKRMFVEVKCGPEIIPSLAKAFEKSGKKAEQLVVIRMPKRTDSGANKITTCVPQNRRLITSRPTWSVPSQCVNEGDSSLVPSNPVGE